MALIRTGAGSYVAMSPYDVVSGGFSWNKLTGTVNDNWLQLNQTYYGSQGLIDLGNGIDRITINFQGRSYLDIRNVEFVDGTARYLSVLNLLNPMGNTFSTNGGLTQLWGTGRNDNITQTGNRGTVTNGLAGAVDNGTYVNLQLGNDRLNLVGDIVRNNVDQYHGGAGTDTLELRNTAAGTLIDDFSISDGNLSGFEYVELSNTANGNINVTFAIQSENLHITDDEGDDTVVAGTGNDTIYGNVGLDSLSGGGGDDLIFGGNDWDVINGGNGSDVIYGNGGNYDGVAGDPGNRVTGGAGADTFYVGYSSPGVAAAGDDVVLDWDHGTDTLNISSSGVALIGGLYGDNLANANTISLRTNVNNNGLAVIRGREQGDTILDSAGADYIYGNQGNNQIDVSAGGSDRVYFDTFTGKQFVTGFATANDHFYLDKRVVDAFYGAGSGRALTTTADFAPTSVGTGTAYSPGWDYLYGNYYYNHLRSYGAGPYTNAQHAAANAAGDPGSTTIIGGALIGTGAALMAATFGIFGASLIVAGGLLVTDATEHQNWTYNGGGASLSGYLNVLTAYSVVNTTVGVADNVNFLDFFGGANLGDGFAPVLEFTGYAGAIHSYLAVNSDDETFVYLVNSSDNLIENNEAIKVAEINGRLTAADFVVYDGAVDIYNPVAGDPVVVLATPMINDVLAGNDRVTIDDDEAVLANNAETAASVISVRGQINAPLAADATINLYDGATQVATGTITSGATQFTLTDSRDLSASIQQIDDNSTTDNIYRYNKVTTNYSVQVVDPTTELVTKSNIFSVTVSGVGSATVNGGGGSDTILLEETSAHLNGASDAQIQGIEVIDASPATSGVTIDLHLQSDGFSVSGSDYGDVITGSTNNDTIMGFNGQDSIDLSAGGNDQVMYSYAEAALDADSSYDEVSGMIGGSDAIRFTDWTNRDADASRLMFETSTVGSNVAVASATELLVVSNSSVSAGGDLTNTIATALGSAFNVAGLDGNAPSDSTGGGADSTSLFAVLSDQANKWWIGRYVDSGNDDTVSGADIAVYGLFETTNVLNSFWLGTALAPQQLGLTMPADSGLSEGGTYTTNAAGFSVTGLQSGNSVYYSLNGGGSWATGATNLSSIALGEGTHNIQIRQVDASGNYSPLSEITSAANTVIIDRSNPTVSNLAKSGSTVGYAAYQAGLGDITLSWDLTEANNYDTVVEYKESSSQVWIAVGGASDATGNQSVNLSDLAAGTYNWRVTHTDKAGNSTTTNGADFTLTPPDVNDPTYSTNSTFDSNGYGYFAYVFSDAESGIASITVNQADVEVRFQGNTTGGTANDGWYGEYNDGWLLVGNELRLYPRGYNAGDPSASGPAYDTWSGDDHRALLNVVVTDNAGNQLLMNDGFEFDAGNVGYYYSTWSQPDIDSYLVGIAPSPAYSSP